VTDPKKPESPEAPPETPSEQDEARDPRSVTGSVAAVSAAHHDEILAELEADQSGDALDSEFDLDVLALEAAALAEKVELDLEDDEPDEEADDTDDLELDADEHGSPEPSPELPPLPPSPAPAVVETLTYFDIVWTQFKRNRVALVALWFLAAILALAIFAPLLSSDRPFVWVAAGERTYPWFRSLFDRNLFEGPVDVFFNLLMAAAIPLAILWTFRVKAIRRKGLAKRVRRRRLRTEALLLVGVLLVGFFALLAFPASDPYVLYPRLVEQADLEGLDVAAIFPPSTYTPRQTGFAAAQGPSSSHLLGTDASTRDVAVRILYGTRISLTVGVIAVGIYVFIGILLGATAGYFGGWVDVVIQRLIEVMMSVPGFFVILTVMAFIEDRSIFHIMVVLGLIRWTTVARLVRGEFLRLRNEEFVTAAEALGFPRRRIIFGHILPNALGPVLVAATFGVAACILIEASLSFLGLGDLTAPSWGQTIQEGYATGAWHLILVPGFAIFATVSALNLVGEGLRDALDPRLRQ
jgi:peptide/nickel transport system permease protein